MDKDLVKAAFIGLAAGVCLSAQMAPQSKEIAMARCTKPAPDDGDGSCAGSCGNSNNKSSDTSSEVKCTRKSAARKVLEGG